MSKTVACSHDRSQVRPVNVWPFLQALWIRHAYLSCRKDKLGLTVLGMGGCLYCTPGVPATLVELFSSRSMYPFLGVITKCIPIDSWVTPISDVFLEMPSFPHLYQLHISIHPHGNLPISSVPLHTCFWTHNSPSHSLPLWVPSLYLTLMSIIFTL